jgi:spermidine synthase
MTEDDANDPEKHAFLLKHGHIIHGAQFVDPQKRRWPTTYYGEDSGAGVAIAFLHKSGPIRVGAVGLGTGTVASYAKPGDVFRFYEINPDVLKFAEERFAFLKDCQGKYEVVLGDARLSMDAEASQQFNLLIVDAFSGDAIPTHLLTREAFDVYRKHLAPGGIIAVHVSNTYLRLSPIVRQLANYCGMHAIQIEGQKNDDRLVYGNTWVLVTANEGFVAAHPNSEVPESAVMPLWTDQYSNLFQILGRE